MAPDSGNQLARFEAAVAMATSVRTAVSEVVFGQDTVVDQCLTVMLAGGHGLLVGVPGLAKTRLVKALGQALGLGSQRVQCTPDLMPSDILGAEVLEEGPSGGRSFRFIQGPVFTHLLMVDEVNRASPRTQSALLEAMEERQVSVAGAHRALPKPFHVLATQNPIEQEGTFALPEAQLDRFLMEIDVPYPDAVVERRIVLEASSAERSSIAAVCSPEKLADMQSVVDAMPVPERVADMIVRLVRSSRPQSTEDEPVRHQVRHGPGLRASQALIRCARARALIHGRSTPDMADVRAVAIPVLRHRMLLQYTAHADGVTTADVIDRLCQQFD